jgi:Ca-activated chloride channel family protein
VGSEAGEPIPLTDADGKPAGYKKDREGRTVLTRTNVAALREVAAAGGGALLGPGASGDLGVLAVVDELARMQRGEFESRLSVQYDDRYPLVAWPAFALLCAAAALGEGPLRRRRMRGFGVPPPPGGARTAEDGIGGRT